MDVAEMGFWDLLTYSLKIFDIENTKKRGLIIDEC
jgi:hypothetical protein